MNQTKKNVGCGCKKLNEGGKRKTRRNNLGFLHGIAVFGKNKNGVEGIIKVKEELKGLRIHYEITGLEDGLHGFHIHEYGDLTEGCSSACSHFNPFGKKHGGLHSKERHEGDLGNVLSNDGVSKGSLFAKGLCLKTNSKLSVLGRMFIVHEKEDDLGMGGNEESLITGNAGARLACGVIGLKK